MAVVLQHLPADVPGDCHDGLFTGFGGSANLVMVWCRKSCGRRPSSPASLVSLRQAVRQPHWFVFIAPVTTVIATVLLVMRGRRIPRMPKVIGWLAIVMSVLANAFVLLGMAG